MYFFKFYLVNMFECEASNNIMFPPLAFLACNFISVQLRILKAIIRDQLHHQIRPLLVF